MDELTYGVLEKLKLARVILIKLSDFEDEKLLAVKSTRSPAEYCWTCTPSLPLYIFKHFPKVKIISYLDADLYFYSSAEPIFEEMKEKSIMVIPHRFADRHEHKEKMNGVYNVGMLSFRRDAEGLKCLNWWRDRCLEWCFYRFEKGRMGDQKYLDKFPKLFKNLCILKYPGAGVGTWNIRQYHVWKRHSRVYINDVPLIFYHFLDLEIYSPIFSLLPSPLTGYGEISKYRKLMYDDYFQRIYDASSVIRRYFPKFSYGFTRRPIGKYIKEAILEKLIYLWRFFKR